MRVLSVSQINFFIKSLIEGDGRMRHNKAPACNGCVRG